MLRYWLDGFIYIRGNAGVTHSAPTASMMQWVRNGSRLGYRRNGLPRMLLISFELSLKAGFHDSTPIPPHPQQKSRYLYVAVSGWSLQLLLR